MDGTGCGTPPPTLVIRGYRDRVFERPFERAAREIPRAEDVNVGASGHMVMLERHDAVNRAIDRFLTSGRRTWRSPASPKALLQKRPWLGSYDRSVPHTISVPPIRLDELLSSAARRYPTRPAVEYFAARISYRTLDHEANRFAHGLLARGIDPGDRVMLLLPNLPQMVIAFFGTLKAGAVAVSPHPFPSPTNWCARSWIRVRASCLPCPT
jgi:long-chain acyl-CoA synthetase